MLTAKVQSGIDALDRTWDGLYRGAAYLIYGRARSGRDLLTLHLARTASDFEEACVIVSPRRPRDLAIQASTLGFDLEAACESGRLRLLRVPQDLVDGASDDATERALLDLARLAREAAPDRLLVEDFTPFVRFGSFERLRHAVLRFLDALTETETTTVLALGEPANPQSEEVVAFLRGQVAGTVHIAQDPDAASPTARRLSLLPGLDSLEPETMLAWDLARLRGPGLPAAHALFTEEVTIGPSGDGASSHADAAWVAAEPAVDDTFDEEPLEQPVAVSMEAGDGEEGEEPPIRFFDPRDPFGPTPDVEDPFATFDLPSPYLDRGHYLESEPTERPAPPTAEPSDPFASAAFLQGIEPDYGFEHEQDVEQEQHPEPEARLEQDTTSAAEPEVEPESTPAPLPPQRGFVTMDELFAIDEPQREPQAEPPARDERAAFEATFDAALATHRTHGVPFLVLALRMEPESPAAVHFGAVADGMRRITDPDDVLLVDERLARLAVALPGRPPEAAQATFRALKGALREAHPEAEAALATVSAIVVPNGQPFSTAADFLAYVMSGA